MPIRSAQTRRTSTRVFLALAALLGMQAAAHAQAVPQPHGAAACPALADLPAGTGDAAIAAWMAVHGACQRNPAYLAALGRMLIQAGRYSEASDHLERALMFDPALNEARVDYAIALAGVGDTASAQALLDALLAEASLPPHLRLALQFQRQALAAPPDAGWQYRMSAAARLGYDSNLGGAPNLGALSITIGGQPVILPLDESYQARAGIYARADWQLEMRRQRADGSRWDVLASVRARRSPSVSGTGTHMAEIQAEYRPAAGGPGVAVPYAGAALGLLQAQAGARYVSLGAMAGWGRQWSAGPLRQCQGRLGGELQQRQHQTNAVLTGHYLGAAASLVCERDNGAQWLASARAGLDAAQHADRPGGNQHQYSLRLAAYLPLAPWWRSATASGLLLDAEASHYRDATGYSPLLGQGAVRTLQRQTARLEYQFTLRQAWQWSVGAEWVYQRSSLELFRLQSHGPYIALRTQW